MSFSRPRGPPQGILPRSRSDFVLTDRHRERHSPNRFQRRPLRTSHSTQCLLSRSGDSGGDVKERTTTYSVEAYATATYTHFESVSGSDSEYSEYDLVNEQMQEFLLDSEDTSEGDADVEDLLSSAAVFVGGIDRTRLKDTHRPRAWRRSTVIDRRRIAKKSDMCAPTSSATRVTPSSSPTLLSDLDAAVRESVVMGGVAKRCSLRRQTRATLVKDRRWLVPSLPGLSVEAAGGGDGVLLQWPWFTVVFDLDETLVGARYGPIHLRPYVGELLHSLHRLPVEIIVWTAGTARYVNPILQAIGHACGRRQWFHHIISRHKRWYRDANTSVKDLSQLGRPLDRLVMVENNPVSALSQPSMCVLLEDYLQPNPADESLLVLKGLFERVVLRYARVSSSDYSSSTILETAEETSAGQRIAAIVSNTLQDETTFSTTRFLPDRLSVALLMRDDAALQWAEFRMEDIVKEGCALRLQNIEMKKCVGAANRLACLCLRYTPPFSTLLAPATPLVGDASETHISPSLRSYGSINPLHFW